jgi:hypothetical protein
MVPRFDPPAPMSLVLPTQPTARDLPWGLVTSTGAHVLLIGLIPLLALTRPLAPPPPPPAVEVELIRPAELEPATPPAAPVLAAPQAEAETAEAPAPPENGPVKATQFFASRILAEDKRIAAALPTLGNDERLTQLCNIEALEQIRTARTDFAPDTLVPYAFADTNILNGLLTAPGAAFRSRRRWWAVSLKCAVAPDYSAVTDFEFTLGDEIPREQWEAHYLTEEEAEE